MLYCASCVCQLSTELVNNQRQGAKEPWTRELLRHLCTTAQGALRAAPVHRSHLISGCAIVFDTASFTHIHIECLLLSLQFSLFVHYPNEMGIYYAVYRLAVCVCVSVKVLLQEHTGTHTIRRAGTSVLHPLFQSLNRAAVAAIMIRSVCLTLNCPFLCK